jgi:hypothetical protein
MIPATDDVRPTIPFDDCDLVSRFESLGDNCEFGILQRCAGAETPSLFRFNFTQIDRLIAGLDNRFADLAMPGHVRLDWDNEWMVKESRYGFSYHTFNADPYQDRARLLRQQTGWLRYMAAKFMEGLALGDRIYVRKGQSDSIQSATLLDRHLRQHGPITLLWVTVADADHPAGTVEWMGEGFMRGWLQGFAPYIRATDLEPIGWMALLRRAWALRHLGDADAFAVTPRQNVLTPDFGGWTGTSSATAEFVWTIPSPDGGQVMKHVSVLNNQPGEGIFGCLIRQGLASGRLYLASVHVWIASDSTATSVGILILGRASLQSRSADLSIRDAWQLIWVSATLAEGDAVAFPQLTFGGPAGSTVHTAGWRLEEGAIPRS